MEKYFTRFVQICLWSFMVFMITSCAHNDSFINDPFSDTYSITFKRTYRDALRGDQSRLKGWLKKPKGEGPFPAVVLLIDREQRALMDREWEEKLVSWGYVVLQVDSMGSRGIALYDYGPDHFMNLYWYQHTSRANDAMDAKNYLAGLPYVNASKIAVMGWGYGGAAIFRGILTAAKPFQAAISFYPMTCEKIDFYFGNIAMPNKLRGFNAPLMIMAMEGVSGNYGKTSRSKMVSLDQNVHEVQLNVYPVADPGFDLAGERTLKIYHNIAAEYFYFIDLRYNREAAMDSNMKVKNFLAKHLQNSH